MCSLRVSGLCGTMCTPSGICALFKGMERDYVPLPRMQKGTFCSLSEVGKKDIECSLLGGERGKELQYVLSLSGVLHFPNGAERGRVHCPVGQSGMGVCVLT
jgi:hypothetical protein